MFNGSSSSATPHRGGRIFLASCPLLVSVPRVPQIEQAQLWELSGLYCESDKARKNEDENSNPRFPLREGGGGEAGSELGAQLSGESSAQTRELTKLSFVNH